MCWITNIIWINSIVIFGLNKVACWNNYIGYYKEVIKVENGTTSFIVNSLWKGNKHLSTLESYPRGQCNFDLEKYQNGVYENEEWALKMLDSSSHMQSGFLQGNLINYGNFDECININYHHDNIQGKYCNVVLRTFENDIPPFVKRYNIIVALCLPASCSDNTINYVLKYGINSKAVKNFVVYNCESKLSQNTPMTVGDKVIISVLSTIILIAIISTFYDSYLNKRNNLIDWVVISRTNYQKHVMKDILLAFSLRRNLTNLFKVDSRPNGIQSLHGLRFMAACGVLTVHRFVDAQPPANIYIIEENIRKWYRALIMNAYIWVDLFFLMGGLLITYNYFSKPKEKRKKFVVWKFYLHRYIRITPPLVAAILIYLLFHNFCYGPQCYYLTILSRTNCLRNWWSTLLYINNFLAPMDKCLLHSWYTSADMQLYILAPIILFSISKWPQHSMKILCLLLFANISIVFYLSYTHRVPVSPIFVHKKQLLKLNLMYESFYCRAGPWIMGLGLGLILVRHNEIPFRMSKRLVIFGWMLAIICCTSSMFGIATFLQEEYKYNVLLESLYKALYRNIWAAGLSWIIFSCYTGYGGMINRILSSPIFHPLSRISYSFYLIHMFVQFLQYSSKDLPRFYTDFMQVSLITTDIILSLPFALVLYLLVEAPALNLEIMSTRVKETYELLRNISGYRIEMKNEDRLEKIVKMR